MADNRPLRIVGRYGNSDMVLVTPSGLAPHVADPERFDVRLSELVEVGVDEATREPVYRLRCEEDTDG